MLKLNSETTKWASVLFQDRRLTRQPSNQTKHLASFNFSHHHHEPPHYFTTMKRARYYLSVATLLSPLTVPVLSLNGYCRHHNNHNNNNNNHRLSSSTRPATTPQHHDERPDDRSLLTSDPRPPSSSSSSSNFQTTAQRGLTSSTLPRPRTKKGSPAALRSPLVDSDLLRFLSNLQRQKWGFFPSGDRTATTTTTITPSNNGTLLICDDEVAEVAEAASVAATAIALPQQQGDKNQTTIDSSVTSAPRHATVVRWEDSPVEPPIPEATTNRSLSYPTAVTAADHAAAEPWLSQYNGHRVTQLLLSYDPTLDPELARLAGERVQSEALARTARRRIREFLKERDRQWKEAEPLAAATPEFEQAERTDNSPPNPLASVAAAAPSFGLRDTLDLLLDNRRGTEYGVSNPVQSTATYGLTARDVCQLLIHTPSIALMLPHRTAGPDENGGTDDDNTLPSKQGGGETLQETLDRVLVRLLGGTLKLRKYDARKVLRASPGLLTQRGSRNAEQTVALLAKLNVSTSSLARDKAALPVLLRRSPAALFRLVSFLSSDAIRMPLSQVGPLLRQPKCQELLNAVAPVVPPVSSQEGVADESEAPVNDDVNGNCNRETTRTPPAALSPSTLFSTAHQERRNRITSLYRNMTQTAWTLRDEIGTVDLGRVIAAYPSVLLLDAGSQILPVAQYLMDDVGVWKDDLARVLQLYPVLLGRSVDEIDTVVQYLRSLGVDSDSLALIVRSFPSLLTLSVEGDMQPVVDFLRDTIGIADVGRFVSRLPPVLGYSVGNDLEPKWAFLDAAYPDARFEVTRFPAYFSYPLERVIATRFEYLSRIKGIPSPLISLDQVLRYGDKDFSVKVAKDMDHGAAFATFSRQRREDPPARSTGGAVAVSDETAAAAGAVRREEWAAALVPHNATSE